MHVHGRASAGSPCSCMPSEAQRGSVHIWVSLSNVPAPARRQRRASPPSASPSASLPPRPPPRRLLPAPRPPSLRCAGYAATTTAPRWHRARVRHPSCTVRTELCACGAAPPRCSPRPGMAPLGPTCVRRALQCRRSVRAVVSHSSCVSAMLRCAPLAVGAGAIWSVSHRRTPPASTTESTLQQG